ncbi:hypothetical protein RUMOBE_01147 [Blautia obeum ATCC 29174]|uniref:Uncharacterized protein n=1 Tax=Blautia obeum ATCC 29174 TaxID=411459 RepID=A5ZQ77_9FIRM|nr:hypothetical protein RUMOBE_01147 [Blautia obeum ATCC 29174]
MEKAGFFMNKCIRFYLVRHSISKQSLSYICRFR